MALKTYNPVTPGQRQLVLVDRSGLHAGRPVKALTKGKKSNGGRNNGGSITIRYRGGGHKKAYREIDFKRRKFDVPATVERLEYDPNRTGFIALVKYKDGEQSYILAPQRLSAGDTIAAGEQVDIKPGNAMPVGNMPVGTIVHNVEIKIGKGGQIARSAGSYAQIVGRDPVSTERISTGVPKLDTMLDGKGFYRGSTILVSGTAGTGKTSLSATFADAACLRGERCLYFAFEESPRQIIRNMGSIGMDLARWVKKGLLKFHSARPSLYGLEMHLVTFHKVIEEFKPEVFIVDPISNLINAGTASEVKSILTRLIDYLKMKKISTFLTDLTHFGGSLEQPAKRYLL